MAKKVYIQDIELTGGGSGGEVAWDDITGKPTFAGVATSGDYEDLENKPDLNAKQDALVSGESIKTVNNESLLGSGNIKIEGGGAFVATYDQTSYADVKDAIDANKPIVVDFPNNKNLIIPTYCTYAVGGNITMHGIYKSATDTNVSIITLTPQNAWTISHDAVQPKLVSGTNIKTINNESLLGSGNIEIDGGFTVFNLVAELDTPSTSAEVIEAFNYWDEHSDSTIIFIDKNIVTMASVDGGIYFFQVGTWCYDDTNELALYYYKLDTTLGAGATLEAVGKYVQPVLVSGTNIKTINNESLLDSGNIDIPLGDLTTLTTEDQSSLVAALNEVYEKCGEPFRVKQWGSNTLNVEIPCCTEDIANTSIPKMEFSISGDEGEAYQVVGMIAYEIFDAATGGNRINCWPVCQFTGNGQKTLTVRWMCGGTSRKTAKRISAWVLLKRRA